MFDYMESCRQSLPTFCLHSVSLLWSQNAGPGPQVIRCSHTSCRWLWALSGVLRVLLPRTTQTLLRGECFHPLGMTIEKKNQKYLFYLCKRQKRRRKEIPTQLWSTPRMLAARLRLEPGARSQGLGTCWSCHHCLRRSTLAGAGGRSRRCISDPAFCL